MRALLILSLSLSFSAFGQRVKENVKQQTAVNGSKAVVSDFEVEAAPATRTKKGKGK